MTRLLAAACAALLTASAAMAGPGCGDGHDVTADAAQDRSLTEGSEVATASPIDAPAPSIDLLALLNGALPSEAAIVSR